MIVSSIISLKKYSLNFVNLGMEHWLVTHPHLCGNLYVYEDLFLDLDEQSEWQYSYNLRPRYISNVLLLEI